MSESQSTELVKEVRKLTRLLIELAIIGKSQTEQAALLSRVGLAPKEIANIVGTTPNTVRVTLAGLRKKRKKKGNKK